MVATVEYVNGAVRLIDQRRLPGEEVFVECRDYLAVAQAIRTLAVRGAPAIGVTAALGLAVGRAIEAADFDQFWERFRKLCSHGGNTSDGGQSLLGHCAHAILCPDPAPTFHR